MGKPHSDLLRIARRARDANDKLRQAYGPEVTPPAEYLFMCSCGWALLSKKPRVTCSECGKPVVAEGSKPWGQ